MNTNLFAIGNYLESVLWLAIAITVVLKARHWRWRWHLFAALVAFGVSDLVEVRTGAWWRSWWLLAWKGVCVASILVLLITARKRRAGTASRTTRPAQPAPEQPAS